MHAAIKLVVFAQLLVPSMMVPPDEGSMRIGGAVYQVEYSEGVQAAQRGVHGLRIVSAASTVQCANARVMIDARLNAAQEAKALIHETVHIAQRCDHRRLPVDERIAQDLADLMDSSYGGFVMKELVR